MPISFFAEETEYRLKHKMRIRAWLQQIAKARSGKTIRDLNIILCSDEYLLGINREYLQHDYYTDIITFDHRDSADDPIIGDLYISVDRVAENAQNLGTKTEIELLRVMAHGLLHLLGFGDKTNAEIEAMRAAEQECLQLWGID
jgi:rRNA maturation RNase YbeY